MPLLYSAPLANNLRRQGGLTNADTDLADFQTTSSDGVNTGYSAVTYSTGIPGRLSFDGDAAELTCVGNATGAESFGTRSEIRFPKLTVPETGYVATLIGFDFEVVDLPVVADGKPGYSIAQAHCGIPDTWLTWMLFETNGELSVAIPASWVSGNAAYTLIGSARYVPGEWNRLRVQHWLSKDGSGLMRFYLNDVSFATITGQTVHSDTSNGPYFKVGIYNVIRRTVDAMRIRVKNVLIHEGATPFSAVQFAPMLIRSANF